MNLRLRLIKSLFQTEYLIKVCTVISLFFISFKYRNNRKINKTNLKAKTKSITIHKDLI